MIASDNYDILEHSINIYLLTLGQALGNTKQDIYVYFYINNGSIKKTGVNLFVYTSFHHIKDTIDFNV